uniref:Uncharacterized protein n=1 Tax=Physcomitrium patens TaxID=3218 RepID=A0A2K1IJ18_PHYPA|nr:hypothetical protein PHYPA_027954 [Physcomitrium patens]
MVRWKSTILVTDLDNTGWSHFNSLVLFVLALFFVAKNSVIFGLVRLELSCPFFSLERCGSRLVAEVAVCYWLRSFSLFLDSNGEGLQQLERRLVMKNSHEPPTSTLEWTA